MSSKKKDFKQALRKFSANSVNVAQEEHRRTNDAKNNEKGKPSRLGKTDEEEEDLFLEHQNTVDTLTENYLLLLLLQTFAIKNEHALI